jgi:hypothetical protein
MIEIKPTKTFRGTWEEILRHQSEIPEGSTVEVNVYESANQSQLNDNGSGHFGGKSLYEVMTEIGFSEGGPVDLAENAEDYLAKSDFGVTKNLREIK